MASLNKVQIIGNLGRDPEARFMPDGGQITSASVATTYSWKDKASGEKKEETEWHKVVFRGRLAEVASEYLKKGSPVYVEGRLRTRKWQDKDGQDRYSTEIIVDQMQMLGSRRDGEDTAPARSGSEARPAAARAPEPKPQPATTAAAAPAKKGHFDDMEDDIPF